MNASTPWNGRVLPHRFVAAAAALAVVGTGAVADTTPRLLADANSAAVRAVRAGVLSDAAEQDTIWVPAGHSVIIDTDKNVELVAVADPEVADVTAITPTQVRIVGKQIGSTDVTISTSDGKTRQVRVYVETDLEKMSADLSRFLPGSRLELSQSENVVVVTGQFARADQADALHRFMDSADLKYVDMTAVAGVQQVQLQVRVAEASRKAIRALGVNWITSQNDFIGAGTIGGNPNGADIGPGSGTGVGDLPLGFNTETAVASATTLLTGFPSIDLALFIEALEDNQYMRTLAEPTLVALTGEEASFLVGGEFPVPIVQGSGVGVGASVTIEYKEFGIRLRFRPTVLGDNTIRLHVAPEVSDLSDIGAVDVEGFSIPALIVRRAETTIEMESGQTFAMAGLIDRKVTARSESVPGFGRVPVLGALLRSVRYEHGETELLVLTTVDLIEPMNSVSTLPVPGDAHVRPDDWELYAEGKIEGEPSGQLAPGDAAWIERLGLSRLKGPGAWTKYGQASVPVVRRRYAEPAASAWFSDQPDVAEPASDVFTPAVEPVSAIEPAAEVTVVEIEPVAAPAVESVEVFEMVETAAPVIEANKPLVINPSAQEVIGAARTAGQPAVIGAQPNAVPAVGGNLEPVNLDEVAADVIDSK